MIQLRKDKTWAMLTQIVMPMIESIKIDYWLMGFYQTCQTYSLVI